MIGFDVADNPVAVETLRAVAEVGGGSYFDAHDPGMLEKALKEAVQLSYQALNEQGDVLATGLVGGPVLALPPGRYQLRLDSENAALFTTRVQDSALTVLELDPAGTQLRSAAP